MYGMYLHGLALAACRFKHLAADNKICNLLTLMTNTPFHKNSI